MSKQNPILDELADRWSSPLVAREQRILDQFSGGLLNARTLANLDSLGKGPTGRIRIGKKVCYPTKNLVEWLQHRVYCNESE